MLHHDINEEIETQHQNRLYSVSSALDDKKKRAVQ